MNDKEYHCKDCYYFTYWNGHTKEEGFGTCCADGFSDPCNGNNLSCNLFDLDEEKIDI